MITVFELNTNQLYVQPSFSFYLSSQLSKYQLSTSSFSFLVLSLGQIEENKLLICVIFFSLFIVYRANIIATFMYIDYACIYQIFKRHRSELFFLFFSFIYYYFNRCLFLRRELFFSIDKRNIQSDYDDRVKENDLLYIE